MAEKLAINIIIHLYGSLPGKSHFQNWYISMQFIASRTLQLLFCCVVMNAQVTGIGIEHFNIAVCDKLLMYIQTNWDRAKWNEFE